VVLPQFATKNHAVTLSLLPPPWWDRKRISLTEQQREKKTTINNPDKKQIQRAVFSPPNAQLASK